MNISPQNRALVLSPCGGRDEPCQCPSCSGMADTSPRFSPKPRGFLGRIKWWCADLDITFGSVFCDLVAIICLFGSGYGLLLIGYALGVD